MVSQLCCLAHPVLRGPLQPLGQSALAKGQLPWLHVLRDYFTCFLLDSMVGSRSDSPVLQYQSKFFKTGYCQMHSFEIHDLVSPNCETVVNISKNIYNLSRSVYVLVWGFTRGAQTQIAISNFSA